MSHIVKIATDIKDKRALNAACLRLGLSEPVFGTYHINQKCSDCAASIKFGKNYSSIRVNLLNGEINYSSDNISQQDVDKLVKAYAIEYTKQLSREQGYTVDEQKTTEDGWTRLVISAGGG